MAQGCQSDAYLARFLAGDEKCRTERVAYVRRSQVEGNRSGVATVSSSRQRGFGQTHTLRSRWRFHCGQCEIADALDHTRGQRRVHNMVYELSVESLEQVPDCGDVHFVLSSVDETCPRYRTCCSDRRLCRWCVGHICGCVCDESSSL